MKKILSLMLSSALLLSVTPSFAKANENTEDTTIPVQSQEEYTYNFNGVEITSNVELSDEEVESVYNEAVAPKNASSMIPNSSNLGGSAITPFADEDGGGTRTEIAPYYRTYKNTTINEAKNLIFAYMMKKIPKKITDNVFANWLIVRLNKWSDVDPTYVGSWASSAWSNYDNRRNYHATLVHYAKSNYTSPKSVQYYQCNSWFK